MAGGHRRAVFRLTRAKLLAVPLRMVRERTNMPLVYVSMDEKSSLDIREFLSKREFEIDR